MTAKDDINRAVDQLEARGRATFSPAEVIAVARALGCTYPDVTLRTVMLTYMQAKVVDGTVAAPGGFVRMSRGVYCRLLAGATTSSGLPVPPAPPSTPRPAPLPPPSTAPVDLAPPGMALRAWHWEGNVQSLVIAAIAADGWMIRRVSDTSSREHGIDVEAERDGRRLLVEVKGYPDSVYKRGERAGAQKGTGAIPTQARSYFGGALLTGLLMRAEHPEAAVAIAFPAFPTYENLRRRTEPTLARIGVEVWLVSEDGRLSTRHDASSF